MMAVVVRPDGIVGMVRPADKDGEVEKLFERGFFERGGCEEGSWSC